MRAVWGGIFMRNQNPNFVKLIFLATAKFAEGVRGRLKMSFWNGCAMVLEVLVDSPNFVKDKTGFSAWADLFCHAFGSQKWRQNKLHFPQKVDFCIRKFTLYYFSQINCKKCRFSIKNSELTNLVKCSIGHLSIFFAMRPFLGVNCEGAFLRSISQSSGRQRSVV